MIIGDSVNLQQNGRKSNIGGTEKAAVKARYKLFPELDFSKQGYTMQLDTAIKVINGQLAYLITVTGPDAVKVKIFL